MKAQIIQFRRGRKTYKPRHFIIDIGAKSREEAQKSIGKEVRWTSPGKNKKIIIGKIKASHGNKGLVRAIFEKGLPGQAISEEAEVK